MIEGRVDILLPTQGARANGLIYQIYACLNQSYQNIKLWVLIDSDEAEQVKNRLRRWLPEFGRMDSVYTNEVNLIIVPEEWRGNWGHRPIRYALEKLPLEGEWLITTGDDDCIMEWGIEKLVEDSHDVDMVVGICHAVKRNHDATYHHLGEILAYGRITGSCCLYRRSRLQEIGYDDSTYESDWKIIEKMMDHPYRQIQSVIFVMPQSF